LTLSDVFYHARSYWDHSILAQMILFSIASYAAFTLLIVVFEFIREITGRRPPRECGYQLVACWVANFLLVLSSVAVWRIFDHIPR
jgi:hypothetical protein